MSVFDGLRVVELAAGMAGPLAGMVLADNGADVLKIEPPEGDWARFEPAFLMWNRGKGSVALDLRDPAARERALELMAGADVVIEAFRPGVARRLGVSYEDIAERNPGLIYCSISGFGPREDLRDLPGYEWTVGAKIGQWMWLDELLGAAAVVGDGVGQPRDWPLYKTVPINSYAAAQLAVQAVSAGLLARAATGRGQYYATSLVQGATALAMRQDFANPQRPRDTGTDTVRQGIRLAFLVCACKDGQYIQMCARQEQHFRRWMVALGLGDVLTDPRYAKLPIGIRSLNDLTALEERIRERMLDRTRDEWIDVFIQTDVGADPFLLPAEFLDHPQMVANGRVIELTDPRHGPVRQPGPLALMSATPSVIERSAPALGQATPWTSTVDKGPAGAAAPGLPLAGVTILELAYYVHAPLSTSLLAELGARVIKVEPMEGDPYRLVGLESAMYLHGKESIALDLKTSEGMDVLRQLIASSDVLCTSFRPGVPERLGFGYEQARALNPRLVYVSASGYGSKGPWSQRAAMHSTPHALAGPGFLQAGEGNAPVDDGFPDPVAGLGLATAMLLGLVARHSTGEGQHIETTMLASMAYAFSEALVQYDGVEPMPAIDSAQRGRNAVNRLYRCDGSWLLVSVVQRKEWIALAQVIGHDDWVTARPWPIAGPDEAHLVAELSTVLANGSATEWEVRLRAAGVPAVAVGSYGFSEFLYRNEFLDQVWHAELGDYWRIRPRIDFDRPQPWDGRACVVGEHTRPIMAELGYDDERVAQLVQSGRVGAHVPTAGGGAK